MKKYYSRLIEKEIDRKLKSSGAVVIVGPKFCGKTTTAMLFQKSMIRLNTKQIIQIVSMNPAQYLEGDKPRLIDEWQTVPDIWNSIKNNLDLDYEFGKFILTGSSTPADKEDIYHSGAGRITPIKMKTMSLFESNESKGKGIQEIIDIKNKYAKEATIELDLPDTLNPHAIELKEEGGKTIGEIKMGYGVIRIITKGSITINRSEESSKRR